MVRCWPYSQQMFSCLASERDHRPCCAQRGLPASCLDLCSSEGMAVDRADLQYLSCLQYMPGDPILYTLSIFKANYFGHGDKPSDWY